MYTNSDYTNPELKLYRSLHTDHIESEQALFQCVMDRQHAVKAPKTRLSMSLLIDNNYCTYNIRN